MFEFIYVESQKREEKGKEKGKEKERGAERCTLAFPGLSTGCMLR